MPMLCSRWWKVVRTTEGDLSSEGHAEGRPLRRGITRALVAVVVLLASWLFWQSVGSSWHPDSPEPDVLQTARAHQSEVSIQPPDGSARDVREHSFRMLDATTGLPLAERTFLGKRADGVVANLRSNATGQLPLSAEFVELAPDAATDGAWFDPVGLPWPTDTSDLQLACYGFVQIDVADALAAAAGQKPIFSLVRLTDARRRQLTSFVSGQKWSLADLGELATRWEGQAFGVGEDLRLLTGAPVVVVAIDAAVRVLVPGHELFVGTVQQLPDGSRKFSLGNRAGAGVLLSAELRLEPGSRTRLSARGGVRQRVEVFLDTVPEAAQASVQLSRLATGDESVFDCWSIEATWEGATRPGGAGIVFDGMVEGEYRMSACIPVADGLVFCWHEFVLAEQPVAIVQSRVPRGHDLQVRSAQGYEGLRRMHVHVICDPNLVLEAVRDLPAEFWIRGLPHPSGQLGLKERAGFRSAPGTPLLPFDVGRSHVLTY